MVLKCFSIGNYNYLICVYFVDKVKEKYSDNIQYELQILIEFKKHLMIVCVIDTLSLHTIISVQRNKHNSDVCEPQHIDSSNSSGLLQLPH